MGLPQNGGLHNILSSDGHIRANSTVYNGISDHSHLMFYIW